jgi:glycosyltransferase involved in cell wall biosynthesis
MPPAGRVASALSRYTFLDEEIRALAAAGIEVYVLSAADNADSDHGRIHVRSLPPDSLEERGRSLAFLLRHANRVGIANIVDVTRCYRSVRIERFAAHLIGREKIGLIHSYFGWPRGFGGQLAKAETQVPLVAGLRGSDVNTLSSLNYGFRLDPFFDRAFRRLLTTADATISVSEFVRQQALALGADPFTSRVILKGVRLDQFRRSRNRTEARAKVGAGPDPVILAVAGFLPIKGLNHVLDALALVRRSGRPFTFLLCGEGPQRTALEHQVRRLELSDCVKFCGRVSRSDIASYFAAADLLVHGSIIEASGNVLLEALASGVPVVCTDAGGPAEYVTDGVSGFVVPVADPVAMARRIGELIDDPPARDRLGRQAREQAERKFAYERMIAETLRVYESIIGPNRSATGTTAQIELPA